MVHSITSSSLSLHVKALALCGLFEACCKQAVPCMKQEQEMQSLHDAHVKEMTKLRYELEQARTEGQHSRTLGHNPA